MLRGTIVSVSEENDKNLISFIASTVETMRDQMATKADLAVLKEQMATKAELAAVKDHLARVESQMATKDDLAKLRDQMDMKFDRMDTKVNQMATKVDLARLETTMHGEFEQVHLRLDSIDRGIGSRMGLIETDVSRMRSVLYLLVKDKPDMLRLLGQPPPSESRPQS
jgi:hypothetical protein